MPELKSTCKNSAGLAHETQVHLSLHKKYHCLLGHRLQMKSGELDLVYFKKPNTVDIYEVKSEGAGMFEMQPRIAKKQLSRLKNSLMQLQSNFPHMVISMHLAVVTKENEVQIIEDFLADV